MSGDHDYGGVPEVGTLTENERAWIIFLRLVSRGRDPGPTLRAVQALRVIFEERLEQQ